MTSLADSVKDKPADERAAARFVTDSTGRTLFYPNGLKRRGYVVTDAERERALHAAAKRLAELRGYAAAALVTCLIPCLYWLIRSHPLGTVGVLLPAFVTFGALVDRLIQRTVLGGLLDGLEPSEAQEDNPLGRFGWINAWPVAMVPVVVWLMLHS